jgi:hypothetical protein
LPRWFVARRGLVVGICGGVATGQLVFLPLLASLTDPASAGASRFR